MNKELTVNEILQEFKHISIISKLKEEDNVIREIIRGIPRTKILERLQSLYPEENITKNDLDGFLLYYKDVFQDEAKKLQSSYGRRIMKQQEGLTNELLDLAITTKNLINKFQEDDDNTNTVGAIRVAADIFMKVGKIQGVFNDSPEINLNMKMDKVVQNIASGSTDGLSNRLKNMLDDEDIIDVE